MITLFILALITVCNIIVIRFKWNRNHKLDSIFDLCLNILLLNVFGGSYEGTLIAMITSFFISIYLWFNPPKIFKMKGTK